MKVKNVKVSVCSGITKDGRTVHHMAAALHSSIDMDVDHLSVAIEAINKGEIESAIFIIKSTQNSASLKHELLSAMYKSEIEIQQDVARVN